LEISRALEENFKNQEIPGIVQIMQKRNQNALTSEMGGVGSTST
jgi:hypothetical protein